MHYSSGMVLPLAAGRLVIVPNGPQPQPCQRVVPIPAPQAPPHQIPVNPEAFMSIHRLCLAELGFPC